ncbi:MAG: hypothetical protein GVY16_00885 [Planctomycetes bacterium]|jgi:hypothetical protein|nr:hypothetical protein [Planctomycetota bacterium]
MSIWPAETEFLVKTGFSLVPMAAGLLCAEGLALRTRMFGAARLWAVLAIIFLAAVTMCIIAGVVCWALFAQAPSKPVAALS